jgi:hypothetical protein
MRNWNSSPFCVGTLCHPRGRTMYPLLKAVDKALLQWRQVKEKSSRDQS